MVRWWLKYGRMASLDRVRERSLSSLKEVFEFRSAWWDSSPPPSPTPCWQRICLRGRRLGSVPGLGRSHGGGHGNPLQCSCLENPRDRGVWWAPIYGVSQSQTRLMRFSSSSSSSLMYAEGNPKPALYDNLEGWGRDGGERGVQEGGDPCIPMANSCWCMAQTI